MTVHIGEVSSEVVASPSGDRRPEPEPVSVWEERRRIAVTVERLARDRMRTTTGDGRD